MIEAFLPLIIGTMNVILGNLVVNRLYVRNSLNIVVFGVQLITILLTYFELTLLSSHMIVIFVITIVFTIILISLFFHICEEIFSDVLNEQRNS
jgi:predicted MFS family arabinose efflux permease